MGVPAQDPSIRQQQRMLSFIDIINDKTGFSVWTTPSVTVEIDRRERLAHTWRSIDFTFEMGWFLDHAIDCSTLLGRHHQFGTRLHQRRQPGPRAWVRLGSVDGGETNTFPEPSQRRWSTWRAVHAGFQLTTSGEWEPVERIQVERREQTVVMGVLHAFDTASATESLVGRASQLLCEVYLAQCEAAGFCHRRATPFDLVP